MSLGGGTGRRTGLKIPLNCVFNNIRDLRKTTENIVQTHDWRGFLAVIRTEGRAKLPKIHRRGHSGTPSPSHEVPQSRNLFCRSPRTPTGDSEETRHQPFARSGN